MYYWINPITVFTGFVIALVCLSNKREQWYKTFPVFLFVVSLVEVFGNLIYFYWHRPNNHWLYNAYLPLQFSFISWVAYKICKPYFNSKPFLLTGLAVFIISYCIESFRSGFLNYSSITKTIFSVWMIVLCFVYYYRFLQKEERLAIWSHADFWIISGLFFFYFVSTASNLFFDYLVNLNKDQLRPIRYTIFLVLNIFLYGSWSYAFICKYRQTIVLQS